MRLTQHLLTPRDNLQKTHTNADLSWFTDGSYSRDENGKYAKHTITTLFKRVPLPLPQQAELQALYSVLNLSQRQTQQTSTRTVSMPLGWPMTGMLWKGYGKVSLPLMGTKLTLLLDAILLPAAVASIKITGHSRLDSLEAEENRCFCQKCRSSGNK